MTTESLKKAVLLGAAADVSAALLTGSAEMMVAAGIGGVAVIAASYMFDADNAQGAYYLLPGVCLVLYGIMGGPSTPSMAIVGGLLSVGLNVVYTYVTQESSIL
jgi:hypothetical protein